MAKTVGKLVTVLSANAAPFRREMGKAGKSLRSFGRQAGRLGAGVGAGLTAGVFAIDRMTAGLDKLAKRAKTLRTTTEQLSTLGFIAKRQGVDVAALEGSIEKLQVRIGDTARDAGGEYAESFERLGISIADIQKADPVAAFFQISNALQSVDDNAVRSSVAAELLGKSFGRLRGVTDLTKSELGALRGEARKFGAVVSTEVGEQAEKAQDQITNLKSAFGGLRNQMLTTLGPAIEHVLTGMTGSLALAGELAKDFNKTMDETFGGAAGRAERRNPMAGNQGQNQSRGQAIASRQAELGRPLTREEMENIMKGVIDAIREPTVLKMDA